MCCNDWKGRGKGGNVNRMMNNHMNASLGSQIQPLTHAWTAVSLEAWFSLS